MASSPKMCAWCQAGVRVQRANKSTHRRCTVGQEPAGSHAFCDGTSVKRYGAAWVDFSGGSRKTCDARRSEQCQRKRECQAARAEDGAERHQASSPAQTRRCLPSCTHTPRPSDARSAAAAPRAPPGGGKARRHRLTGAAAKRPMSRCGGTSPRPPNYLRTTPAPAYRPASTHSRPPSRSAGRSYPAPPPLGRGATAPSSPAPLDHRRRCAEF